MEERIAQPLQVQQPQVQSGGTTPLEKTTNDNITSQSDVMGRLEKILERIESYQPPVFDEKQLRKGQSVKAEWSWTDQQKTGQAIDQLPQFRLGAQALGLSEGMAYAQQNEVADIVKEVIEHMQSSEPEHIYRFLSHFMRTVNAKSLSGIRRELAQRLQEEVEI